MANNGYDEKFRPLRTGDLMAERQGRSADTANAERPDLGKARVPWWTAVLIGMGGVLVGVLLVGILSVTNPAFVQERDEAVASAGTQPSGQGTIEVQAQAQVNAACLSVINSAQDVYSILSDTEEAVTEVDLRRLDDMVRRLDPIQQRLETDLPACEITTSAGSSPGPSTGPSPQATGDASQPAAGTPGAEPSPKPATKTPTPAATTPN